jgi:hypothetical protein
MWRSVGTHLGPWGIPFRYFWRSKVDSKNPSVFEAFLDIYTHIYKHARVCADAFLSVLHWLRPLSWLRLMTPPITSFALRPWFILSRYLTNTVCVCLWLSLILSMVHDFHVLGSCRLCTWLILSLHVHGFVRLWPLTLPLVIIVIVTGLCRLHLWLLQSERPTDSQSACSWLGHLCVLLAHLRETLSLAGGVSVSGSG